MGREGELEARKREEADFHDRWRAGLASDRQDFEHATGNRRFYAIARQAIGYVEDRVAAWAPGRKILDYCCGEGRFSFVVARNGGEAVGIDISPVSIENCRRRAQEDGVAEHTTFLVMDAEDLRFPDDHFDHACVSGVLHHLDLDRAYAELARVVVPGGSIVALEALGHNPVIRLYRRLTPQFRTAWEMEHILRMKDIARARRFFRRVDVRFFNLTTLLAIPLIGTPLFRPALTFLEAIDAVLLRLPLIREQAWMAGILFQDPIKRTD